MRAASAQGNLRDRLDCSGPLAGGAGEEDHGEPNEVRINILASHRRARQPACVRLDEPPRIVVGACAAESAKPQVGRLAEPSHRRDVSLVGDPEIPTQFQRGTECFSYRLATNGRQRAAACDRVALEGSDGGVESSRAQRHGFGPAIRRRTTGVRRGRRVRRRVARRQRDGETLAATRNTRRRAASALRRRLAHLGTGQSLHPAAADFPARQREVTRRVLRSLRAGAIRLTRGLLR